MQITQPVTSHRIMSCQSISYIVEALDEYLTRLAYLEILALRYIISDISMISFSKGSCSCNRTFQNSLCGVMLLVVKFACQKSQYLVDYDRYEKKL